MIFNRCGLIAILFLLQFLVYDVLAEQQAAESVSENVTSETSEASETIKKGEQVIVEQKKQLVVKRKQKTETAGEGGATTMGKTDRPPKVEENADNGGGTKSVSEIVEEGEQVILNQKKQLEKKEESEAEMTEMAETKEKEARIEIYEQQIIQQAVNQAPMAAIDRQLQRERFRREIMTAAGKEIPTPFRIQKKFNLRLNETYDSNIFLTDTNKTADYITTLSPSILLSIGSKYICGDINYVMDIAEYKNKKDQSGISHLVSTYIRPGTLSLPFLKRKGGKIGYEIQDDFQPFAVSVATSEQTQRTDSTYNKFSGALDYYMNPKRTLALEYTNTYRNYRTAAVQRFSYIENEIAPTFYFNATPKWSLFAGYEYMTISYTQSGMDSSTSNILRCGVTGTLFSKVLTHFEIGNMWRVYKEPESGNIQKAFFRSALSDRFTSSTSGTLRYDHTIEESTYTNNPYFISDEVRFDLQHKLTYKTMLTLGLGYIHNGYDTVTTEDSVTQKRADTIWTPSIGMKYYFKKWLSADLNYTYTDRKSDFKQFSYIDNKILGAVNVQF